MNDVPSEVIDALRTALRNIARIEGERAGYKRIGMGDRFDADLDAAIVNSTEIVAEFRRCAAENGVDADAVIAALEVK